MSLDDILFTNQIHIQGSGFIHIPIELNNAAFAMLHTEAAPDATVPIVIALAAVKLNGFKLADLRASHT